MFNIYANEYAPIDPLVPPCDINLIPIGHVGEDQTRCLVFDLTDCVNKLGEGTWQISFVRPGDNACYICTNVEELDNSAIWIITDIDTAYAGYGVVQLLYFPTSGGTAKTSQYRTVTFESNGIPGDAPDPYEGLLEQIAQLTSQATAAASTATAAAQEASTAVEEGISTERSQRIAADEGLQVQINTLEAAVGGPLVSNTAAGMTDTSKIYVYTGSESGYTFGHWYYYAGANWADGGVYQASAVETDPTLSVEGMAADAAACGDLKCQTYAAFVTESTSGSIASFDDGADDVPVKDLVVNIEPSKDSSGSLVGYTKATIKNDPEYGGTIIWNQLCNGPSNRTSNGVSVVNNGDGSATLNGTATARSNLGLSSTITNVGAGHVFLAYLNGINEMPSGTSLTLGGLSLGAEIGGLFKNTANYAALGYRVDFAAGTVFDNLTFYPQWYDLTTMFGAEVADYVYGLEQSRLGAGVEWFKNIFPKDYYAYNLNGIETNASAVNGDPYGLYEVEFGSAGTVYGGTLDVTSGMLTVTYVILDLGAVTGTYIAAGASAAWTYAGCRYTITDMVSRGNFVIGSNAYTNIGAISSWSDGPNAGDMTMATAGQGVIVRNDSCNDAASYKAALNGVYIAYECTNPVSVQLTATEVLSLLGNNNIWSNTGSVESCEYRADTKLYLEKLTNPDNDMTADSNIASGQYFMVGNTLYVATTAIASGTTITPGTNCTETNLAAALNAINA